MRKTGKRLGALLLALVMIVSLVPVTALAARVEDDAVQIAAPETAVHEAKPAGAVDAEDVPAVLAEGEATNIAQGKTIHAYNKNGGSEDTAESGNPVGNMVDGTADDTHRWAASADMKTGQGTGATANDNPKTVIIDLGENKRATNVTQIKIVWHALVWSKNYTISTAADEYASRWTTVYTANAVREDSSTDNAVTDEITQLKTTTLQRFVKFYFEDINLKAGGSGISIQEIEIYGTLEDQPTITQYVRHTGKIQSGATYLIYANGFNLHNTGGTKADHCSATQPVGDTLALDHINSTDHAVTDHQWVIAGNETNGYTIQGVTAGEQNYLKATGTAGKDNAYQLALGSDSAAAVKLTFTPSGNGYTVSYVDGTTTKYLRWSDDISATGVSNSRGWNFSTTENVVQIFKQTVTPVTIAAADDGSRDVGAESGAYSNENNAVIDVKAPSQQGTLVTDTSKDKDGPVTYAVDGDVDTRWHTRYTNSSTTEEIATSADTNSGLKGWGESKLQGSLENRWIELDIVGGAQWLSGLRYLGRNSGGDVLACEIRVWDETAGAWATVTSSTAWTIGNGRDWSYKEFDCPVQTSKVRLYGVDTHAGAQADHNKWMIAREIRLVKALTETAPATQTVTVTVTDAAGSPIEGATVSGGGKVGTTGENGQATLALVDGKTYTLTASKEGLNSRTVSVTVDGEAVTAEVKLREAIGADDRTHDYPLTAADVTAYSWENSGNDLPPYAALDDNLNTHWHTQWTGAEGSSGGNDRTNGKWFQFTVREDSRKVFGVAYRKRSAGNNITTWVLKTSETEKTDAEWFAAPAEATGTFHTTNQNWQLAELEESVDAKYVRIYATDNDSHSTAAELRLVLDPSEKFYDISGQVTNASTNAAIEGATVSGGGKTATTDANGNYTLNVVNGTYTLTVSKGGFDSATIENVDATASNVTQNISLTPLTLTLTGTVKGADGSPVEGARLTLLTHDDSRNHTEGVEVATSGSDGTFSMGASAFGLGQAYLLVTQPNYETKCVEVTLTADNGGANALGDISLTASAPYKVYTFDGANAAAEVAEFTKNDNSVRATVALDNGAMKYTMVDNANTLENIIVNKNFVLKNGTVEFDVTPITSIGNARFGVVLHVPSGKNARIHIGQRDTASQYGYQSYNHGAEINNAWGSSNGTRPAMQQDVTRHIAITLNGNTATINVDGMEVWQSTITLPSNDAAGYIGFTTRYGTTQFLIDNIVVRRADEQNTVSWTAGEGESLTAAIVTPDNTTGTELTSGGNAFAGDTIKITGTKTGAILNAVTVNEGDVTVNKTEVTGGGYAYTFTMPAGTATVVGTFVDLIPNFTVSGADESGNISAGTYVGDTFTGNTLAITGELASDTGATIEWYKKDGDGDWEKITTATGSSYTIQEGDYNDSTATKLKVKVTGNGTHHAGWKERGEFTVTAPVYAVTDVSLERDTLTMWTNYTPTTSGEFPTEVGSSATLTATVAPDEVTNPVITWTSSKPTLVTVTPNETDPKQATLNVVSTGVSATAAENTATITVSVAAGGKTETATCVVTVKTKAESITVNGLTNNKVIVYTNDGEDSIDVTATVLPATASDKTLVWTRPATGSSLIKIDRKSGTAPEGEGDDMAESSGAGVTITAIGSYTNVGQVTVTVKAKSDETVTPQTFTVEVRHKLAEDHNITIANDAKVGTTLTVNTGALIMTTAGKSGLTYKWYRLDAADAEITEGMTAISEDKEYTLVSADKDKYIAVVVTAAESTYYEGTKKAVTAKVELADGPAAPALTSTAYSKDLDNNITYGTIAITSPVEGETYEYRQKTSDADASEVTWSNWQDVTAPAADGKITITNLGVGDYQVRIKANGEHKAGTAGAATVKDATKTYHNVTVTTVPETGAGTVELDKESVEAGQSVTLTVTPAAAYNIESVKNGEETLTGGTPDANGAVEYTVSNVGADVAFAVTFKMKQVTITLALTNLTATCNVNGEEDHGASHTVDYGAVTTITLTPATGHELPKSITVTYTDGTEVPTTRCEYDNETGEISFPNGVQRNITITAEAPQKKYSVQLADDDGVLSLTGAAEVNHGAAYTGTLSVSNTTQYALPETLTSVTMGDKELTADTEYTYDSSSGAISIPNVTGDVVITATAVAKKTQLTGVTIGITHSDSTGMGESNKNVPHVGDTLTATAAPTGATVTYQWFVGNSATAAGSGQTYKVKDGDTGEIKVVVTGTDTFEGTKEATTAAVGAKTWRVTGVSLNKTTTSLEFQGEETLTATVTPSTASNKNVTWSSSNTAVATVDANGKVTAAGVGTATITVTTADGGKTATCRVTVTAKALPQVKFTGKPQAGQTASVSFTGGVSTDVATYEWYIGSGSDGNTGEWIRQNDASGASWTVPENIPSGKYIKVIANAKGDGNYSGTSTAVSAEILSNDTEVTKYAITTTTTGEGTVALKVKGEAVTEAAEDDEVTVEVTGVVTGATVAVTSSTDGVTLEKGTGNTWTFTMPAKEVAITVTITEPVVEKYAITVNAAENGTVTANKTEAAEGATVTLTVTPDEGYKLGTLTVTGTSGAVTVAEDNTFEMPGEAVTVTATFVVDTTALDDAIAAAKAAKTGVVTKPAETAEDTVSKGTKYVTEAEMKALTDAITAAEAELAKADKTAESMAAAATALNEAVETFKDAIKTGTKQTSSTRPSSSTSTVTNPDGSTTTTTTKPDGTKVETTEKPDGTKETVETKRDGTVIETTEKPDGTTESVKTQPDGTVVETVVAPDGTKESVMTQPDGTVTETVIDTEGAMTEKVTDPEENVTITVTDPEGEELAKLELPATVEEPETKFDDIDGHWAEESINKVTALGLVNGVGNNKYGTESSLTRGQLATVLYRLSNGKSGYRVSFSDVEIGKYYTDGVAWAAKAKVVTGYTTDIFAPEDTITREQLAVMLCRYAKLIGMDTTAKAESLNAFADGENTGAWAVDGVAWCVENGILKGKGNDVLDPTSNVTRAQVAVMLDRFIELIK